MMKILRNERQQAMAFLRGLTTSIGRRVHACFRSGEEGGALVEFALVAPLMLTMVTGIYAVGIAFNNQLTLTQAVGTGAQRLQVIRTSTSDPCADTLSAIEAAAPNLKTANISLTVTINGGTPQTGTSCTTATSSLVAAQGDPVTVSATYPCNLQISGVKLASACQLAATVTEYEY